MEQKNRKEVIRRTVPIRLGLPKGRMEAEVRRLLADAGIDLRTGIRGYRAQLNLEGFEAKILKPQNIVEMLQAGSRDIGFAGADWVRELDADLIELVDTGLDPVRIVAAAPAALLSDGRLPDRPLIVASEYPSMAAAWIEERGLSARFVRSYGATEVFPPDDADCIVDNTATGSTLRANALVVVDELMSSSTRLFANARALDDHERRRSIDSFVMLLGSVLEARRRVTIEMNVTADRLEAVVSALPAMRQPTVSPLYGNGAFAVKAAVPREEIARVIPRIKSCGGTDVLVTKPSQIVP